MTPDYNTTRDLYAQIDDRFVQIDPLGAWGAPCRKMDTIAKDITITFGPSSGTRLNVTIPKRFFNLGPYPGKPGFCQAVFSNPLEPVINDDGRGVWVIGSPLLKNYYTAWNGLDLKIGFAQTCH
ncbi:putative acid protease protein [Phaeoacremonium minimum UCRPA7]|uniref:Putative acid protease protein n=1 Tax=Phaeoacremonium minimum (strain UCR-PA7) TaxID=1286976 RepID=R8BAT6_PHAM7|nr:putative acid protease protein [Phaeoacremonium minimum UCRPA7]EON96397.1 putative acid protease protein [Phaeoacremonium minimum UCRPA7]